MDNGWRLMPMFAFKDSMSVKGIIIIQDSIDRKQMDELIQLENF